MKEVSKMSKYSELAGEVRQLLRLRTVPIGIKLFEKAGDIPQGFDVMDSHCTVCQVIGMARYYEKAVAAPKEWAFACAGGAAVLGFCDIPDDIADGTRNVGVWAETKEAAQKIFQDRLMLEKGRFEAFGVAPLSKMSMEPDVVQVWGTPAQILALVYANIWDGGGSLELSTNGHGASCYEALVVPYLRDETRLAIADIGDRRYAYAADDEVIAGIPGKAFERLTENLRSSYTGCYRYPYEYYFFPMPERALERNRC
jgi:uncharacterized protein (DUF169 family)